MPILAPVGFLEHAVSENICAGNAMNRRAVYMYVAVLDREPAGQLGAGLGLTNTNGSIGMLPPTLDITRTGQQETLDGVRLVFQPTPGTEAPAEMNFLLPTSRRCAWPRTPPTTCPPCAGPWCETPQLVAVPDREGARRTGHAVPGLLDAQARPGEPVARSTRRRRRRGQRRLGKDNHQLGSGEIS